ncbi:hypothetical protein ACSBR1_041522 [Camellia fascicularis]
MVVGGTDTTSSTVEFALAEMMNKPQVLRKAQQEVETVVGKDNIVEESHIHKLPYLYAVMKETLRLHPALPLFVPHCPTVLVYLLMCGLCIETLQFGRTRWSLIQSGFWGILSGIIMGMTLIISHLGPGEEFVQGLQWRRGCSCFRLLRLCTLLIGRREIGFGREVGIVLKKKVPLVAIPTPRLSDPALYE